MDTLKELIELAQDNELSEKLAAYCAGAADNARETALIQQGRSNAYTEIAAILAGRVKLEGENGLE